jgi:hypothetical protein
MECSVVYPFNLLGLQLSHPRSFHPGWHIITGPTVTASALRECPDSLGSIIPNQVLVSTSFSSKRDNVVQVVFSSYYFQDEVCS